MKMKPSLELAEEDFNGIYAMLGEAWRANSGTDGHYQDLAKEIAKHATNLAQCAFALGVEVGKSNKD